MRERGYNGRTGHPCIYDALAKAAEIVKPKSYLEIGVYDGASLAAVILSAPEIETITLCDTFGDDFKNWSGGTETPKGSYDHITRLASTLGFNGKLQVLVGDSNQLVPTLTGPYDLITVDGDHSYNTALNDCKNTYPLLRKGGLLCFDDSGRGEMTTIADQYLKPRYKELFTLDDSLDKTTIYEKL
jgi:predicted O-methyltransferase YrrM